MPPHDQAEAELQAIATLLRLLAPLDAAARRRVVWYAADWITCEEASAKGPPPTPAVTRPATD